MQQSVIYLDNNSTTRPEPAVVEAMQAALRDHWQNPSSPHRPGQKARQHVELAREAVCSLIGCLDDELVLTSGGTESANLALRGVLDAHPHKNLLVTNTLEHSTVRECAEVLAGRSQTKVIWLQTDDHGCIDLNGLFDLLKQHSDDIALVSVMWANNETGLVQPIERIGQLCRDHGVLFHTDATQWVGKNPTHVSALPIDLLTFSAHKFHGPKGVGGLYVQSGLRISQQIIGGPQQRRRRGGTENVPGIVGMGAAARLSQQWLQTDDREKIASLRDSFQQQIEDAIDDVSVNCRESERLWNTSNIGFTGLDAEAILLSLSERGVCASAGAACSSGSLEPSPVLLAMGISPEVANGSIRFSLSRHTTREEIDRGLEVILPVVESLRGVKVEI